MGKLYFRYGAMSSGKTAQLIGVAKNYEIQGKRVIIFTAALDTRAEQNTVASRNGLKARSLSFDKDTDLYAEIFSSMSDDLHCVLVDEAQFLSGAQVMQLSSVADSLGVPVICFGLKNDFRNRLFEGAEYLLLHADTLEEVKNGMLVLQPQGYHESAAFQRPTRIRGGTASHRRNRKLPPRMPPLLS